MTKLSIRNKMILYGFLLLILVSSIALLGNISSSAYAQLYTESADLYRELNHFYKNMQDARSNAQTHFYTLSIDSLDDYHFYMDESRDCLNRIQQITHSDDLRFRFSLLHNMLQSCDEHFSTMSAEGTSRPTYTGDYEHLIYLFELTDSTQQTFYGYLVNYTELQRQALVAKVQLNSTIVMVVMGVIALISILFSVLFSRWITLPINQIVRNIQRIKKGEYDLRKIKDAGPEFAVLGDAFDDMALSIRSNINTIETNARLRQQLLEAENENLKINEQLTISKLKALQGQMNPHFLFNPLSMISQTAMAEDAHKAVELLGVTTRLLRYSLDKSKKSATLQEEIRCVETTFISSACDLATEFALG